jgi:hypothetical protein
MLVSYFMSVVSCLVRQLVVCLLVGLSVGQFDRLVSLSLGWFVCPFFVCLLVDWLVAWLVCQLVGWLVIQSVGLSVSRFDWFVGLSVG